MSEVTYAQKLKALGVESIDLQLSEQEKQGIRGRELKAIDAEIFKVKIAAKAALVVDDEKALGVHYETLRRFVKYREAYLNA